MTSTVIDRVEAIAAEQSKILPLDLDTESVGSNNGASDCSFAPDDDLASDDDNNAPSAMDPEELYDLQQDQVQHDDNIQHNNGDRGHDDPPLHEPEVNTVSDIKGGTDSNDNNTKLGKDDAFVGPAGTDNTTDSDSHVENNADGVSVSSTGHAVEAPDHPPDGDVSEVTKTGQTQQTAII